MTVEKFYYLHVFIIFCSAQTCPIYTTKQLTSPLFIKYDSGVYSVSPYNPKFATPYCLLLAYNPAKGTIISEYTVAPPPLSITETLYPEKNIDHLLIVFQAALIMDSVKRMISEDPALIMPFFSKCWLRSRILLQLCCYSFRLCTINRAICKMW